MIGERRRGRVQDPQSRSIGSQHVGVRERIRTRALAQYVLRRDVRASARVQRCEPAREVSLDRAAVRVADRARARGVETELAFAPSEAFSASLAYTFTDAVNLSTGAALLRQPKHKGTIAVSWSPVARLSLSSSLLLNGQEADTPAGNDAFARLDLRAAYRLGERLELYGRVENATDTDYQDVSGYGEPGAAAFGGMRVRL